MSGVSRPAYEVALDLAGPWPCAPSGGHGHPRLSGLAQWLRPLDSTYWTTACGTDPTSLPHGHEVR